MASAALFTAAGAPLFASGQTFPPPGTALELGFTGAPVDFVIPTVNPPSQLRLAVKGGNGGSGNPHDGHCEASGGRGALIAGDFHVGTGVGELAPGGILRFIIGEKGEDEQHFEQEAAGGGGGGSGVLYFAPAAADWVPLLVAGGGGGGAQSIGLVPCFGKDIGEDASLTECGTEGGGNDGGWGGCNGDAGVPGLWPTFPGEKAAGGGGGGLYHEIFLPHEGETENACGGKGGPQGGKGGVGMARGGWGCGGGGAGRSSQSDNAEGGGGGGGYSGGGGGHQENYKPRAGGGGGSYVAPYALAVHRSIHEGSEFHGFGSLYSYGSGAFCDQAVPLLADPAQTHTIIVDGEMGDPVPSVSFSCNFGVAGPDLWYVFTNDLPVARSVTFRNLGALALYVEQNLACGPGQVVACGSASGSGVTFDVPANEMRYFRLETPQAGFQPGAPFSLEVTFEAVGPDHDGDGVVDLFDICAGDDSADADQDGIPDECDGCITSAGSDCDGNGIQDPCDLTGLPARFEIFNQSSLPDTITVAGINGFVPTVVGGSLMIGDNTDTLSYGSVVFEPVSPTPVDSFGASFYARIDPSGAMSNGLSFCLFDAAQNGSDTILTADGSPTGLVLRLRPAPIGSSHKEVELLLDGQVIAGADPAFEIDDGVWRRFRLEVAGGKAYVFANEWGQPIVPVINGAPLPGFVPFVARYGFGALSVTGGADPIILIDEVRFDDWSGLYDRDLDGNGTLDSCETPALSIVVGTPANPDVLIPGITEVPLMGYPYDPYVDHSTFQTGAVLDYLFVSSGQVNAPSSLYGTLLVQLPQLATFVTPAGDGFGIPIPYHPLLLDAPVVMQAVSYDPTAAKPYRFTNALVTGIGGWRATF